MASKIKVGVLRGGPSREHEISLKSGQTVLKNMPENYFPIDIFIDKEGVWHVHGIPRAPEKILRKVDVCFNALHGEYGEDGQAQHFLDLFSMPYTGSGRLASAFAMHKGHSKKILSRHGIKSPYGKILRKEETSSEKIAELFRTFPNPSVIKPVALGSSIGVSVAKNFSEFEKALEIAFAHSPFVMIEEYISGREATCGIIDSFRGEENYALLPVEIIPPSSSDFFDYDAKYGVGSNTIHPGRFSAMEKYEIQNASRLAHKILGLRHYSRSDFIVSPSRGVYFLEVNSLPDLASDSSYVESLNAVGASLGDFLNHVLVLALSGK